VGKARAPFPVGARLSAGWFPVARREA